MENKIFGARSLGRGYGNRYKVYEQLDNKSTKDTGAAYTWKDNSTSKDRRFKSPERLSTNHMSEYLI